MSLRVIEMTSAGDGRYTVELGPGQQGLGLNPLEAAIQRMVIAIFECQQTMINDPSFGGGAERMTSPQRVVPAAQLAAEIITDAEATLQRYEDPDDPYGVAGLTMISVERVGKASRVTVDVRFFGAEAARVSLEV